MRTYEEMRLAEAAKRGKLIKAEVPFAAEDACLACDSPSPVDWERVGPKLVEAGYAFIDSELGAEWRSCTDSRVRARMGKSARAEGLIAFRAALAATQPEGREDG